MKYDFEPTPDKFGDVQSLDYRIIRRALITEVVGRDLNLEELPNILKDERFKSVLSRATWDQLEAKGLEPDGLEFTQVFIDLEHPDQTIVWRP